MAVGSTAMPLLAKPWPRKTAPSGRVGSDPSLVGTVQLTSNSVDLELSLRRTRRGRLHSVERNVRFPVRWKGTALA